MFLCPLIGFFLIFLLVRGAAKGYIEGQASLKQELPPAEPLRLTGDEQVSVQRPKSLKHAAAEAVGRAIGKAVADHAVAVIKRSLGGR